MNLPVLYKNIPKHEKRVVREKYIELQEGKCYYCKCPLEIEPSEIKQLYRVTPSLFPKGFFDNPIHLHHSHVSGLTLGAVHAYCNAVLWEHLGE